MEKVIAGCVRGVSKSEIDRAQQIVTADRRIDSRGERVPSVLTGGTRGQNHDPIADCLKDTGNIGSSLRPSILSNKIAVGITSSEIGVEYRCLCLGCEGGDREGTEAKKEFFHGCFLRWGWVLPSLDRRKEKVGPFPPIGKRKIPCHKMFTEAEAKWARIAKVTVARDSSF